MVVKKKQRIEHIDYDVEQGSTPTVEVEEPDRSVGLTGCIILGFDVEGGKVITVCLGEDEIARLQEELNKYDFEGKFDKEHDKHMHEMAHAFGDCKCNIIKKFRVSCKASSKTFFAEDELRAIKLFQENLNMKIKEVRK